MQALIDFDGWRKWREFTTAADNASHMNNAAAKKARRSSATSPTVKKDTAYQAVATGQTVSRKTTPTKEKERERERELGLGLGGQRQRGGKAEGEESEAEEGDDGERKNRVRDDGRGGESDDS